MEKFALEAEIRTKLSKGEMKNLRGSGKIPAILYGGKNNVNLTINYGKFSSLLARSGQNAIIDLNLSDKTSETVLIKDIQKNVVTRKIIHIDFYKVSMEKKIEIAVPVVLLGTSPGVEAGGVCDHIIRELKVRCLPTEIPEKISVDISNLQTGQAIYVKDLTLPENVEVLMQPQQIVVNIVSPTILEEVVPAAGEVSAEPEVIGKGKKEEEELAEEGAEAKPAETKKETAPAGAGVKKEDAAPKPKEEKKPEKK